VHPPYSLNAKQVYIQRRILIPDDKVYPESAKPLKSIATKYKDEKGGEDKNFEYYLA
jgi:hypothetical protein